MKHYVLIAAALVAATLSSGASAYDLGSDASVRESLRREAAEQRESDRAAQARREAERQREIGRQEERNNRGCRFTDLNGNCL